MRERQYIGARYVPKYFENTVTGDSTWAANTVYQPLTVVLFNENFYTSKKKVPATVGAPNANPEYWIYTGSLSGGVGDLATRMDAAELDIDNLQDDVDSLDTRLDTAEGDIDAAEGNITLLDGRMTTAEGNITSLGGRMNTAEGNITSLTGDVAEAEYAIKNLNSAVKAFVFTYDQGSLAANASGSIIANNAADYPNTYYLIGIEAIVTGNANIVIRGFNIGSKEINLRNVSDTAQSYSCSMVARCLDKSVLESFFS